MRTWILRVPASRICGALSVAQVLRTWSYPLPCGVCARGICVGNKRYDILGGRTWLGCRDGLMFIRENALVLNELELGSPSQCRILAQ